MAIIKCKMCGGDIELSPDKTFGTCEYCGSTMTFPKVDDEQRAAAFNRGNHFRRIGEFDKALAVYERIVQENDTDAEAHWCCALCRFGIEYVEDPASYEWLPTCHRASFDSFLEDVDYLAAVEHSDGITRRQYQKDAAKIAEVQRGILATSQNEDPFDVFICYKESDDSGSRTVDSTLAQDIYYQLTEQGRRVFFARITLEDKAGTEYEPYIFAALNSAKVMIAIGTNPEYFNAVWVKNEWSRFLALMKKDKSKLLVPCYRDMDPYDLPEQLSVLQSYDMRKIGFIQDLIRGVAKVLDADKVPASVKENVVVQSEGGSNLTALLKRGSMALEDGEWDKADGFFEQVLNLDAECAEAYAGKLCVGMKYNALRDMAKDLARTGELERDKNYQKAVRFANAALKSEIEGYLNAAKERVAEIVAEEAAIQEAHKRRLASVREFIKKVVGVPLSMGERHTVGLKVDATVVAVGSNEFGQCNVSNWRNIVAVSAGGYHTVGLKSDGTVVATGKNDVGQCGVDGWTDIVAVAAGYWHTVGLRADGTVVAVGLNSSGQCNVNDWTDIVAVAADLRHTVGLRADRTVVAVGEKRIFEKKFEAVNFWGPFDSTSLFGRVDNVGGWTDIVAVAAGHSHIVGLKADGTVMAIGEKDDSREESILLKNNVRMNLNFPIDYGQCNVGDWTDIVAIAAGGYYTVGLKVDGTVVVAGGNRMSSRGIERSIENWRDIYAISVDTNNAMGLKADGTVVAAVVYAGYGQCNTDDWKLFNSIGTIVQERKEAIMERKRKDVEARQQQIAALESKRQSLQAVLPTLKGLFAGGKRKQIEAQLAEIEAKLEKLQYMERTNYDA